MSEAAAGDTLLASPVLSGEAQAEREAQGAAANAGRAQARIGDYAMIGDCRTAALVSRTGSIDWLCLPRFDSDACFAALLGNESNGRWAIRPADPEAQASRRYRDGTLILETTFRTGSGEARVIDFMVPGGAYTDLVRIVEGIEGAVEFDTDLVIRFDYGRTVPWVTQHEDGTLTAVAGPHQIVLRSSVALHGEDYHTVGRFTVGRSERVGFTMTYVSSLEKRGRREPPSRLLARTERYWRNFSDRCPRVGRWSEVVKRSLITLKALTYEPTGGIVAAATTSLPERIGGPRNWDYRYCWLRDATFTLQAFMQLGYFEEAAAWRDWLVRAVAGDPAQMQIMYGIGGERDLWERELPWLPGFRASLPVRVGNAAATQLQLDVHGEVADALARAALGGLPSLPRARGLRKTGLDHLARIWSEPDEGIWEVRGERKHFVHSKVMAWVAFDRASKMLAGRPDEAENAARWAAIADQIHREVCEKGFDPALNSFTQSYGSGSLDASLLQIALVGFLPPEDPRVIGTVDAIIADLMRDGLVLRYHTHETDDGLPGNEGAFLACSFWLADNLCLLGRRKEALALFERLVSLCNDVGLLAEEYDPVGEEMLGNFPQAFSHVGLINTALNLARVEGPAAERAQLGS